MKFISACLFGLLLWAPETIKVEATGIMRNLSLPFRTSYNFRKSKSTDKVENDDTKRPLSASCPDLPNLEEINKNSGETKKLTKIEADLKIYESALLLISAWHHYKRNSRKVPSLYLFELEQPDNDLTTVPPFSDRMDPITERIFNLDASNESIDSPQTDNQKESLEPEIEKPEIISDAPQNVENCKQQQPYENLNDQPIKENEVKDVKEIFSNLPNRKLPVLKFGQEFEKLSPKLPLILSPNKFIGLINAVLSFRTENDYYSTGPSIFKLSSIKDIFEKVRTELGIAKPMETMAKKEKNFVIDVFQKNEKELCLLSYEIENPDKLQKMEINEEMRIEEIIEKDEAAKKIAPQFPTIENASTEENSNMNKDNLSTEKLQNVIEGISLSAGGDKVQEKPVSSQADPSQQSPNNENDDQKTSKSAVPKDFRKEFLDEISATGDLKLTFRIQNDGTKTPENQENIEIQLSPDSPTFWDDLMNLKEYLIQMKPIPKCDKPEEETVNDTKEEISFQAKIEEEESISRDDVFPNVNPEESEGPEMRAKSKGNLRNSAMINDENIDLTTKTFDYISSGETTEDGSFVTLDGITKSKVKKDTPSLREESPLSDPNSCNTPDQSGNPDNNAQNEKDKTEAKDDSSTNGLKIGLGILGGMIGIGLGLFYFLRRH
jgi:hypothetical protein